MVENTAVQVKVKSEEEVASSPAAKNAFSQFRELIDLVGINEELEAAGNVTIFSPVNKAFDKLDTPVEDLPLPTIRRFILKHFVKNFLFKKDMVNGPVSLISIFVTYDYHISIILKYESSILLRSDSTYEITNFFDISG